MYSAHTTFHSMGAHSDGMDTRSMGTCSGGMGTRARQSHRPYHTGMAEMLLLIVMLFALFIVPIYYSGQSSAHVANNGQSSLSRNPIYRENQQPGTTSWQSAELQRDSRQQLFPATGPNPTVTPTATGEGSGNEPASGTWKAPIISGYADQTSVNHGDAINFYVSTSQPSYNLEVYRMGWYNGSGARLMLRVANLPGQNQPVPVPQSGVGLIECNWQISYKLQTASTWTSGAYLAKLIAKNGSSGYIFFVVRADDIAADILYQIPVTTYQAYNNWGGKSLYDFNSMVHRANKVSYDRPYASWNGAGFFFEGDYNMIRWLESHNYNVTYVTSLDTETNPLMYTNRKVFLTNWHDEYWSKDMRDNLTTALNQGENLAFFSADNIYWQIRFEPSTAGIPNRVQVCYKDGLHDPVGNIDPELTTVEWRDAPVRQPENALLGSMYSSEIDYGTSAPWIVTNANHWIYQGTGVKDGDTIPGLIGYEYDSVWNNGFTPPDLQVLSTSPVLDAYGKHTLANGTIYTAASNALVFNAGTIYWPWKLDDNTYQNRGVDRRVQIMTANVLKAMITGIHPANSLAREDATEPGVFSFITDNKRLLGLTIAGPLVLIIFVVVLTRVVVRRRYSNRPSTIPKER
jgi:hypothetical protein